VEEEEMSIGAYCVHKVVTAQPEDTAVTAAQRMAQHDVEALVVTADQKPVGIVTDRDLLTQVLATGGDPQTITLRTVMTRSLLCVSEATSLEEAVALMRTSRRRWLVIMSAAGNLVGLFTEAVALMRTYHIRRLVIVNEVGNLMGVVTPDDLLELVGEHRGTLASLMREDRQGH
jgi:CBS domain-containing protein